MDYKIWLCGITQDSMPDIDICTENYKYFDGLIWVEHNSIDGTRELLESRKGDGEIISMPWRFHHGLSYNAVLTSQKILPNDIIYWCDSLERYQTDFCKNIRSFTDNILNLGVSSVYFYGKILMFKYMPSITFTMATPHCVLANPLDKAIEISSATGFENIRENRRNINRPSHHFIDHFAKYIFEYKHNNNQTMWGCENDPELFKSREQARQKLLLRCRELGINLNLDSLKQYLLTNPLDSQIKEAFNIIDSLNDYYCYYILNHSLEDILDRRKDKKLFIIN